MKARNFALVALGGLLLVGNATADDIPFNGNLPLNWEVAYNLAATEVAGQREQRMPGMLARKAPEWAMEHYLGVTDAPGLAGLRSQARALGEPQSSVVLAEIDRRLAIAQDQGARVADSIDGIIDGQFTLTWNRFLQDHHHDFDDATGRDIYEAYQDDAPELFAMFTGSYWNRNRPDFEGEPVSANWIYSFTPDGEDLHGPATAELQPGVPVVPVDANVTRADVGPLGRATFGGDIYGLANLSAPDASAGTPVVVPGTGDAGLTAPRVVAEPLPLPALPTAIEMDDAIRTAEAPASAAIDPPSVEEDLDAQADSGWVPVVIEQGTTLGHIANAHRRKLVADNPGVSIPSLWGGFVDQVYEANLALTDDPSVINPGDTVMLPTIHWFTAFAD